MYPSGELEQLAQRKALLQARIAVHRRDCVDAAAELARPIGHIDRAIETWQRISPFLKLLAIPAGFVLTRALKRGKVRPQRHRKGKIAVLLSALPLIIRGVKIVRAMRTAGAHRTPLARHTAPL